ncbi:hypothetical protein L6164_018122 [Bauhinia variegata]|uniref:Uncharacterized protein n=1 Tax=Bauhinia variegata TaxID=167791 RepID=A0ACB9NA85_BAUVA|nr:hypothetical protein L6164_018122 [Bauhinia variegata]
MEQSRIDKQLQCNIMEPRNEEFQPASQSMMQDHLDGMHTSIRSSHHNISGANAVRNFSIQTGEEFALEFMRDRANLKKPVLSNVCDPNQTTGYMELKGILGISHTGSASGSDISMLSVGEKGPKELDRKNGSLHADQSNYGSIQSVPRTSFNRDNSRFVQGYTSSGGSDSSSMTMKVLCSFGGRVLPRPSDGKLRYVGGETRLIRIRKDISWLDLMQKTLLIYNQLHVIKYQLPEEDLDALVTVSSDEDLQNMMEEYDHIDDREASQKLRMFLFSMSDLEDAQFGLGNIGNDSEVQYVVAVNGMDLGSRNYSTGLGVSSSANNIHELDRQNNDRETNRVAIESIGVSNAPLRGKLDSSLTIQSSQPMPPISLDAYETYPLFFVDQMIHPGETSSQYAMHHVPNPSNNPALGDSSITMPPHGLINQQGILNEGHPPPSGLLVNNSAIPAMILNNMVVSSVQRGGDPGKVFSLETPSPVPSQPLDGYLNNNFPEAPVAAVTIPEGHLPSLPSMKKTQQQDYEENSSTSSSAIGPAYVDTQSNAIDLSSLHPPPLPKRVYYSERTPREQVELLNRSSKSDDTHGSQLLVSDLLSGVNQQDSVVESGNYLHNGNLPNPAEVLSNGAKPFQADNHTIDNGLVKPQTYQLLPDASSLMQSTLSEHVDPELKQVLPKNEGIKNVVNENVVIKSETENYWKDNDHKPLLDEAKDNKLDIPAVHHVPSVKHHDDPASDLPEINWGEISGKEPSGDCVVQALPVSLTRDQIVDVSQDDPSTAASKKAQADILIDIDDRFPRELLSDMYSKAIHAEDSSSLHSLPKDGVGLSINMENHEPKRWSYFQKLAEEGLDNNVSLIDQDHLDFSPVLGKAGDNRTHHFAPVEADGVSGVLVDSSLNFGEENHYLPGMMGRQTTVPQSNYDHSKLKETESMQFDAMMENIRVQESEYEDENSETKNIGLPPLDPSLGDFNISTLQVIKNEDLEELKELGSGTFGTVYHGKWRGTDVAIKRIKKSCFTGRSSEQERLTMEFWREADILSKLHHPNVVAFYGVVQDGPGGTLATVTEYMVDGSLRHVLLRKDRPLDRRKKLIIAMDAAFGMEYLHSKNIVHFDLKCDNLLVNLKDPLRPICKVGDFGLSKIKRNTLVSGGVRGTLPWMAPELLNGSSNKVSEKVDVFSFGIVLWEILTGEEPYANMHYGAIIGGIVNNTLRPTIPSYCDSEWRTLMEQCWSPNPAARPSFTEIAIRLRTMSAAASQTKAQAHKASK